MTTPLKILACDLDVIALHDLKQIIEESRIPAQLQMTEANNHSLSDDLEYAHVLITDYRFWFRDNALDLLQKIRSVHSIPVIAWVNRANDKIIGAALNMPGVFYIRNDDSNQALTETIRKIFLTIN